MIKTFKRLEYKKFIRKINIIKELNIITEKIEKGKINDKLIKVFYYFIVNTQYNIDSKILDLLNEYNENERNLLEENYFIKDNKLYKGSKPIIENIDLYNIKKIFPGNNKVIDISNRDVAFFYNIKGVLMDLPIKKEEGDKYWKQFLSSSVLEEIQFKIFSCKTNIFKENKIIKLFQNRSYYFPNYNDDFSALSHKDIFYMYFFPRNINLSVQKLNCTCILEMIKKAFIKVDIQHEWGHSSSSFLFFVSKINYFNTPKRECKLLKGNRLKKEKIIKEGGKLVEYLLYGRIIDELTTKEAIYILDNNNYKKSLTDFLTDFLRLGKIKLESIFQNALKNKNIDQCVKDAYDEYCKKSKKFKENIEYYSFKGKTRARKFIDYETFVFRCPRRRHSHYRHSYFMELSNPNLNIKTIKNNNK